MRMKLFGGIALACVSNSALADDTVYYLVPNEGGYAYTAAFTNAVLWTTTATKDKGSASGGEGASLDGDKVFGIQGSKTLNTIETEEIPNTDAVFTGKHLDKQRNFHSLSYLVYAAAIFCLQRKIRTNSKINYAFLFDIFV